MDLRLAFVTALLVGVALPSWADDTLPALSILEPIVLPDPSGDVRGEPVDAGAPGYIDIVEAVLDLDEERLRFQVTMADVAALTNAHSQTSDKPVWADLAAKGERYRIVTFVEAEPLEVDGGQILDESARLYRLDDETWNLLAAYEPQHDYAGGVFAMEVPLEDLRDRDGFPLAPGSVVTLLDVGARDSLAEVVYDPNQDDPRAQGGLTPFLPLYHDDVDVPPDAFIAVPEDIEGLLLVSTEQAIRYSNGGGSFRWPVQVHNPEARALVVEVAMEAPSQVRTRAPDAFTVDADDSRTVDLFAFLPFGHQHGGTTTIMAAFKAGGEATVLPLGVHFLDIPQPAGHHDTLWFHGIPGRAVNGNGATDPAAATMNTLQDDPADTATSLRSGLSDCGDDDGQAWWISLSPRLLIGLDGQTDEAASLQASIDRRDWPEEPHSLHAKLLLVPPGSHPSAVAGDLQADSEAFHGRLDVPLGGNVDLDLELPMPAALDHVPVRHDMPNLALGLLACPDGPTTGVRSFYMAPGGSLRLPLDEYQEALDVGGDDTIMLHTDMPLVRAAAGATILWTVEVSASDGSYEAILFGPAAEHATLHHEGLIGDGDFLHASLVVPDRAAVADLLQVILTVEHRDDPGHASSIVLGVIVDPSSDRNDVAAVDALAGGAAKDTPAPAVAVLVLALLGLVVRGRRRA